MSRHPHNLLFLMFVLTTIIVSGCTVENDCCEAPDENVEWFFIEETGPPWVAPSHDGLLGKAYKCIVCDSSIEEEGVADWILANAGEEFLSYADNLDGSLPCLYVYEEAETAAECEAVICGGDPNVNDPVYKDHGAGRTISPILDKIRLNKSTDK
mgnify:FL=1